MAYARAVPWHGLGRKVDGLQTAAEMLEAAGLDWEVVKTPLLTRLPNHAIVDVPRSFAIVRTSDWSPLGVVGASYVPVQNREAFDWTDALVDSGEAKYETAGSLFGGRRVWASMEIPEGVEIEGDKTRLFILVVNSHDGSLPVTALLTPVRVVCNNTLNLALSGARRSFRIRHIGEINGKIAAAREALGITFSYRARFEAEAKLLAAKKVSLSQVEKVLKETFPLPPTVAADPEKAAAATWAQVMELYRTSPTVEQFYGSAWGVLQAVSEYLDHVVEYRGRRWGSADVRMDSILWGPSAEKLAKAHALVRAV
jgi:phage/plasmid-like protein (TIGR03299 family)